MFVNPFPKSLFGRCGRHGVKQHVACKRPAAVHNDFGHGGLKAKFVKQVLGLSFNFFPPSVEMPAPDDKSVPVNFQVQRSDGTIAGRTGGGQSCPGELTRKGRGSLCSGWCRGGLHALRTLAPGGDQLDKHYFGKKMQEPRKKPKKMPNKKARNMQTKR